MNELTNIQQATILNVELQFTLDNDVWFNATKMVKNFNEANMTKKRLDKFWESTETSEYIEILEEELATPKKGDAPKNNSLKRIINNGNNTSGTYIHPELGILLARYLSPKFARACDKFVKEKMTNKSVVELTPIQLMEKANKMLLEENKAKELELKRKEKILKTTEEAFQNVADDISGNEINIEEYCQLLSSRKSGCVFGRTTAYKTLRFMKLVKIGKTTPTQYATNQGYLKRRHHDRGISTKIVRDKMQKLTSKIIKFLNDNPDINKELGFPFNPEMREQE